MLLPLENKLDNIRLVIVYSGLSQESKPIIPIKLPKCYLHTACDLNYILGSKINK